MSCTVSPSVSACRCEKAAVSSGARRTPNPAGSGSQTGFPRNLLAIGESKTENQSRGLSRTGSMILTSRQLVNQNLVSLVHPVYCKSLMSEKWTCKITHGQISEGTCPWCDDFIENGDVASGTEEHSCEKRRWNVKRMSAALDDEDVAVRSMTVSNLLCHHGPAADVAIPLLSKAINDCSQEVRTHAEGALSRLGGDMAAEEIPRFEDQLPGSEHELATRILLLCYYFIGQRESKDAHTARQEHILWLIQHAPDDTESVDRLRQAAPAFRLSARL